MRLKLPVGELAAVPHLEQYCGEWMIHEPHFRGLARAVENLNIQVHLEQRAPEAREAARAQSAHGGYAVTTDGIAVLQVRGTLMKHVSSLSMNTSLALLRRDARAALEDERVLGAMFVYETPGGTVAGTPDAAAAIRGLADKKPVFSFIEDLCASGGYWLASQGRRISANTNALVGGIGAFIVVEDLSQAAANEGLKVHVVRYGEMKGVGTPGTVITDEQLAYVQERIDVFGRQFVEAVAKGRGVATAKAREWADGRVHVGQAAVDLGLVDRIETLDDAMGRLAGEIKKQRRASAGGGAKANLRGNAMSDQDQPTATLVEARELKPAAATIAELKDNCPGASDAFILGQLEKQATVASAMKAHLKVLADEKAKVEAERDEAAAKLKEAEEKSQAAAGTPKPRRGNEPLGASGDLDEEASGDLAGAWVAEKDRLVAAGKSGLEASNAAERKHPGGRAAWVEAYNADHVPVDEARQRFLKK